MARIFLVLAVVLGFFWWLRQRAEARRHEERAARPGAAQGPAARQPQAAPPQEAMVQCAHCGVHLPQGEAIAYRGLYYCRRAHLPADSDADSPAA
ncbi:PP0621 family protein [Cupriavidus basilensis]|uniref:PP0621 family protein n=1 Tax=Cupriavidus basilensis TaxID=68895 RepID=A0ABT6ALN0_9BURK|nr:PP0621 family protein [Cupriavidus basilensis]MDF3833519.1 PP0621 family protein [Cupriavidus basilensis]